MNSLQYISTQVESLIGSEGEKNNEHDKDTTTTTTAGYLGIANEDEKQQQLNAVIEEGDKESDKDNDKVKDKEDKERLLMFVLLYIPRTITSFFYAFFRLFHSSNSSTDTQSTITNINNNKDNDVSRSLQSPYGLKKKHKHSLSSFSSNRLLFPPRSLLLKPQAKKTLVLDLDETLIHSLSRSSKFSQGQMVEIKLENSQLATLYLVNKRPYCDMFLKAVSEWYKLVIFTASVQRYADPVIDWLEQDRKYFAQRYYRQHCTLTEDGFIKNLEVVEQDPSKMVIIDNSPVSYARNQNNAVAIEGWISDPTDHSLMNLIPFLHALRYSNDVRSILSLKSGESAFTAS